MKHKISLEKIENIILKSKEKSILEKFTAGVDSYKVLCDKKPGLKSGFFTYANKF